MGKVGTLEVILRGAVDLKDVELIGRQDPYAVIKLGQTRYRSKTHTDGGKNPTWNQQFLFQNVSAESVLEIQVVEKEKDEVAAEVYTSKQKRQGQLNVSMRFSAGQGPEAGDDGKDKKKRLWIYKQTEDVLDHYELQQVLGRGTFGTTRQAFAKNSAVPREYACKTISKRKLNTTEEIDDVRREIQIMHHLAGHPNVVKIEGVYEDKHNIHIVMELCTGGELFDRIIERGHYTEKDAADLIRVIVSVVAHCHSMGVMHRDLKPENFLLSNKTSSATLKATDFGLSVFFREGQAFTDIVGSAYYVAPEVLRRQYSKEADIWSCGVILYILLSGVPPYYGETERQIFESILKDELDFVSDPWPKISEAAKDCVRKMLVRDPRKRASADTILHHEWMRENGVASDNVIEIEVLKRIKGFAAGNKMKKEALLVIARNLPLEEIAGLKALFQEIDKDGSGTISVDEFRVALKKKGTLIPESDLQRLMEDADVNKDGTIDYEEFVAATMNMGKLEREEHLIKAFEHFDEDGNGRISRAELIKALNDLHVSNIDEILEEVDKDGSGDIDYQEFCTMMRGL